MMSNEDTPMFNGNVCSPECKHACGWPLWEYCKLDKLSYTYRKWNGAERLRTSRCVAEYPTPEVKP